MRTEDGQIVPATLGEYRDLWAKILPEDSGAIQQLDRDIARYGRDFVVPMPDAFMRLHLMRAMEEGPI